MSDYIFIGALQIHGDLQWIDEFAAGSDLVGQIETVSITGALIVQASAQQAGRKLTLQGRMEGSTGFAPVTLAQLKSLRALAAVPGAVYTVTLLDGRTFSAMFRRSDGPAVEAEPMINIAPIADDDYYFATIRMILV
jgi:hypothetical protein